MNFLYQYFFGKKIKVLMVCTANICRSPMAHAVLRELVKKQGLGQQIFVESAGTHVPVTGLAPDKRALKVLKEQNVCNKRLKTRQLQPADGKLFDKILVMDKSNKLEAEKILGGDCQKLQYLLEYSSEGNLFEVPDPYYGAKSGFIEVFDMVENACLGVLEEVRQKIDG